MSSSQRACTETQRRSGSGRSMPRTVEHAAKVVGRRRLLAREVELAVRALGLCITQKARRNKRAGGRLSHDRSPTACKLVRVLFDSPCTSTIFLPSSMAVRSSNWS